MVLMDALLWRKPSGPDRPSTPLFHPWAAWVHVSGRSLLPVRRPVHSQLAALPDWPVCDSDGWEGRDWALVQRGLWLPLAGRRGSRVGACSITQGKTRGYSSRLKVEQDTEAHH